MQQHMAKPGAGLLLVLLASVGIAPLFTYGLSATSDLVISGAANQRDAVRFTCHRMFRLCSYR